VITACRLHEESESVPQRTEIEDVFRVISALIGLGFAAQVEHEHRRKINGCRRLRGSSPRQPSHHRASTGWISPDRHGDAIQRRRAKRSPSGREHELRAAKGALAGALGGLGRGPVTGLGILAGVIPVVGPAIAGKPWDLYFRMRPPGRESPASSMRLWERACRSKRPSSIRMNWPPADALSQWMLASVLTRRPSYCGVAVGMTRAASLPAHFQHRSGARGAQPIRD
jgi:hypothetical protein